jgi:hypothetical protein
MDINFFLSLGSFAFDLLGIVLAFRFMRRERELEEANERLQTEVLWLHKHALAEAPL